MGKFKMLIKLATTVGPVAYGLAQRYGPVVMQTLKDNPQLAEQVQSRFTSNRPKKRGIAGLRYRVQVLREQVTYLYGTANNLEVAEKTRNWRRELDNIEHALNLVDVMQSKERRAKERELVARIDELSDEVLKLTLEDDIEDAVIVELQNQDQEREQY